MEHRSYVTRHGTPSAAGTRPGLTYVEGKSGRSTGDKRETFTAMIPEGQREG
jgi:hypothetical protein